MQEIGRAGQDGLPACATLFYSKGDIALNIKHLAREIVTYCKASECRRKFLTKYFGCMEFEYVIPKHNCCDICRFLCECELCITENGD